MSKSKSIARAAARPKSVRPASREAYQSERRIAALERALAAHHALLAELHATTVLEVDQLSLARALRDGRRLLKSERRAARRGVA